MLQAEVKRTPFGNTKFFFKKDKKNKQNKVKTKTKQKSGTDFNEYGYQLFVRIQKFFFYISLVLIPIALFPLEWMMFEYGRSFLLIFFTTILLTFELIKFFIRGKMEIYKSPKDIILLLLGLSFVLSLVFSSDSLISFWGYEYRFGTGFVSIISILIYVLVLKSIIHESKSIINLLFSLSLGLWLSALLSILSFYGVNPFGFIPVFEKFFFTGLPLFNSARLSIVIWSTGLVFSALTFYHFFGIFSEKANYFDKKKSLLLAYRKKRLIQILLILLFSLIVGTFVFAITLFSIKNLLWLSILSLVGVTLILLAITLLSGGKALQVITIAVFAISVILLGSSRFSGVQNILSIDTENVVEQVTLDNEAIWGVTMSSLSESFFRSLVGLGNDNFVVAYGLYRPAFSEDIDLNFVNYSYANNELYNIVSNRGLVGLFIWLVVGFMLFKQLVQHLTDEARNKILDSKSIQSVGLFALDFLLIYLWVFSFFVYYSFFIYFLFFLLIVLSSILRNISYKMYSESFVIQTNFFVERIGLMKTDSLPKFFILLVCSLSVFTFYVLLKDFSSRIYAVKAESIAYDIQMGNLSEAEALQEAIENYDEAILRNPDNYVFRRRVSSVLMEYMNRVLLLEFSGLTEDEQKKDFVRVVGVYAEAATEEAKRATELAPTIPLNWNNRDSIYADLVRIGFHNYIDVGLKISDQTIMRNPNNYNAYVNKSMYLYLAGDSGGAISNATRALEINAYNVVGLSLAGEISMGLQDYVNAKKYFEAAKTLLEGMDFSRPEVFNLYEKVQQNLEYLWSLEIDYTEQDVVEQELVKEEDISEEKTIEEGL